MFYETEGVTWVAQSITKGWPKRSKKVAPLYYYRRAAGLTLHELAERARVNYTTTHRAETDGCGEMRVNTCRELLKVLGIENFNVLFLERQQDIDAICQLIQQGKTHETSLLPDSPPPSRTSLVGSYRAPRVPRSGDR